MTYVTANLHGCYTKFSELLRQIKFRDRDVMYVLGDIVDYGDEPMELVCDLSMRYNVYAVAGEHDLTAARMLGGFERILKNGKAPDNAFKSGMIRWMSEGGQPTLDGYRALDAEMKEGVLDYLSDMALYEEITVGGRYYVLVHAGLGEMTDEAAASDELFREPINFTAPSPLDGKIVIAGHVPTSEIPGGEAGCIFHGDGVIGIDCGAGRGGRIGCLRLEDGAEFYA